MSFSNYVPPLLTPEQSGAMPDILGKILSGYTQTTNARYLKPSLDEALKKAQLGNIHAQQQNQYYAPDMESKMALRKAQLQQAQAQAQKTQLIQALQQQLLGINPDNMQDQGQSGGQMPQAAPQSSNISSMIARPSNNGVSSGGEQYALSPEQIQRLAKAIPPSMNSNSQGNKLSIEDMLNKIAFGINTYTPSQHRYAPSNLGKEQQEYEDVQAGYYPGTQRTKQFESPQIQEEYAAPYREKLGGLTQGQHFIYDPESHEKIGIQKPYTAAEKQTQTGRAFFNEVFPKINNGFKDFIGKGSATNFIKYADAYGKDPVATRKIDDLLLAQKLVSAGVVNEAATLGAGRTNMTYRNLAKSFPGSDVSQLLQRYGNELKIPGDAFLKANIRFQNILNQATQKSQASVPAFKSEYFNPEKHLKNEDTQTSSNKTPYTDDDIKATAAKYGISEDEVRKKLKEASK